MVVCGGAGMEVCDMKVLWLRAGRARLVSQVAAELGWAGLRPGTGDQV